MTFNYVILGYLQNAIYKIIFQIVFVLGGHERPVVRSRWIQRSISSIRRDVRSQSKFLGTSSRHDDDPSAFWCFCYVKYFIIISLMRWLSVNNYNQDRLEAVNWIH